MSAESVSIAAPPIRVAPLEADLPASGLRGARPAAEALALGCPRFYLGGSRSVYSVLSSRARGLSIGINLNPDQRCNFDCCYCEVLRPAPRSDRAPVAVNAHAVAQELAQALSRVKDGSLFPGDPGGPMAGAPLRLAHVAISGDGEPTLCPNFTEAVECIVHLRAAGITPYFKLVLLTNASVLDSPGVRSGLRLFTRADEIWVKLDAGTEATLKRICRTEIPLKRILGNITELGQQRPVVIQSMFVEVDGVMNDRAELVEYGRRLLELKQAGVKISVVQVYSATRPHHSQQCRHLSLRVLSEIASFVREATGLRVEVF